MHGMRFIRLTGAVMCGLAASELTAFAEVPDSPFAAGRLANSSVVFAGLDKVTGRTTNFEVKIDETVQFGALRVTPRVCYTKPPTEPPETISFLDVEEITLDKKTRPLFHGWMFVASPGLHAIEHPIYDVWVVECKGPKAPAKPADKPTDSKT